MRKIKFFTAALIILFILISAGMSLGSGKPQGPGPKPISKEDMLQELELFADAITIINQQYAEDVEAKKLIYGALDGMLSSLDSHSSFLTPDDFNDIESEARGEFGGVGLKVTLKDRILTVISPLEGSPAYKAGILPNDKIIKIDRRSAEGLTVDDAVKILRGMPGTRVKITILREGEDKLREFDIRRAVIITKSVRDAKVLDKGIGYIRITEFQQRTSAEIDKAMKTLLKNNARAVVIDLRNNPGGLLDAAIMVCEKFIKRGDPIVSIRGRSEDKNIVFKSRAFKPILNMPIVVLVNAGSASASEIFAGAIKDNKRGIIMGQTTFGKGSVQTIIPLRDGSALRLTTSLYVTPSGNLIHNKGIVPDVEISQKIPLPSPPEEKGKDKSDEPFSSRIKSDIFIQEAINLLSDNARYESILK